MVSVTVDSVVQVVLVVASGVVVLGGAVAVFGKCTAPFIEWQHRVEALERNQRKDLERLDAADEHDKVVVRALIALLEHGETGNATGKMYEVRKELEDYLIEK